jgi:hypothetical protein
MKNIYQNMEAIIIEKNHNKQKITVTFGREKPEIILKTEFYEIGTYKNDNTKKFFEKIRAKDKLDIIFGELGWAVRDSNLKEKKYHSNDTLILNDTTTVEEYQTEKEKKNEKQEKLITHEQAKLAINILQEDEGENITWTIDRIEQLELLLEYVEQHQFKEVLEKRQRSCME